MSPLRAVVLVAISAAATEARADGALEFVRWLAAHPEVTIASVSREEGGAVRARWSDAQSTTLCVAYRGRATCVRHPAPVRHAFTLKTYRGADGGQILVAALGPLPEDARHAFALEFRFPKGTAHARRPQLLPAHLEEPSLPWWASNLRGDEPVPRIAGPAPAAAPALPTLPAPPWIHEPGFSVFTSNDAGSHLEPLRIEREGDVTLCVRRLDGWHCFPTIPAPSLAATELPMPPHDRRLKERPPWPLRAEVRCEGDADCTLLVEWDWERIEIARTCKLMGTLVTLYRARAGQPLAPLGHLRSGICRMGYHRDFSLYRLPRLSTPRCFELQTLPEKRKVYPLSLSAPAGEPRLPADAGRYCVESGRICRVAAMAAESLVTRELPVCAAAP